MGIFRSLIKLNDIKTAIFTIQTIMDQFLMPAREDIGIPAYVSRIEVFQ